MPGHKRKRGNPIHGVVPLKVAEPLPLAKMVKTLCEQLRSTTEDAGPAPVIDVPIVEGASSKLEPFSSEILKDIQNEILSLETDEAVNGQCPSCMTSSPSEVNNEQKAIYRCLECFNHTPVCSHCIVKGHRDHPFHRLQKWAGDFFEKIGLSDLEYVISLGHQGDPCPNNIDGPKTFVVVHTNGTHDCMILYCHCKSLHRRQDKALQLIRHQLFPPSLDRPQTVFTFAVLDDFDRHSLNAKSSNYDYCKTLRDYTNAAFPEEAHHRYKEFKIVMRLWRYLMIRRCSGQEFNIDATLTHRQAGCLALRCPACPEIGFNLEKAEIDTAREDDLHKYTLFLSADGNFRLQRKKKNYDRLDKPLNSGNAYFVEENQYQHYTKSLRNDVDTSLCAKLKAVKHQDRAKFKDAEVSGVIAIQCARHGFYLPQGMADLDKGEAYIKTDYVLMHALGQEGFNQRWISLSYDIWCQYHINLPKRITANLPKYTPLLKRIRGSVPKMHINGHNAYCQINHSFVYEPHSGMTHGEAIESAWSEQNHAASSTKEQNPGHRQETLDSFNGHYNFTKLRQLSSDLSHRRCRTQISYSERKHAFDRLTSSIPASLIDLWRAAEAQSSKSELYQVQGRAPRREANPAPSAGETGAMSAELIDFIWRGLEIETLLLTHCQADLMNEYVDCDQLIDLLQLWRADQHALFPLINHLLPEDVALRSFKLCLPSSFTAAERRVYNLTSAADVEIAIRREHAFDILSNLRDTIHEMNHTLTEKRTNLSSQSIATRSQYVISEIRSRMLDLRQEYCRYFDVLRVLGPKATEGLQQLELDQLWGKNLFIPHTTGDSNKHNPWFWSAYRPDGMSSNEWSIELERVWWYREKAAVERLKEELEILEEEFRRSHKSFVRMSDVWKHLAAINEGIRGYSGYALRQASMYAKLADKCLLEWRGQVVAIRPL